MQKKKENLQNSKIRAEKNSNKYFSENYSLERTMYDNNNFRIYSWDCNSN